MIDLRQWSQQNYPLSVEQQSRVCNIGKTPPEHSDGMESVSWAGFSGNVVQGVGRHPIPLHFTACSNKVRCFLPTVQYAILDTMRSTLIHFNLTSALHRQYRTELCNFLRCGLTGQTIVLNIVNLISWTGYILQYVHIYKLKWKLATIFQPLTSR